MSRHEFNLFRALVACLCMFVLIAPDLTWAVTNDGYQGNTVSGRPSIAVVGAPGGTSVNTFTGNVLLPRAELNIPGRGLPIELRSTYNSDHDAWPTPFGYGWTFNYDMKCQLFATRDVVVEWGNGRMDRFLYKNGSYTAANEGVADTLQQVDNTLQVTSPQQIQYVFDATSCLLQKIQDPNGNALTFSYNGLMMTTITDAAGRNILLSYDGNGRVIQITDPNAGRTLEYTYDAQGDQTSFTDPLGNTTNYSYDSGHRLTQVADQLGVTTITYGAPNNTVASVSRSDLKNNVLSTRSFAYDTVAQTTTVTDVLSANTTASTRYHYDANLRLTQITDPLERSENRTYDANGYIASVTDPLGHTTQYTCDAKGNLLTRTDALGHTTTFTYDPVFNKLTSVTDANGHTDTYTYDSHGNIVGRQDGLGALTKYSYDSAGELVSRQDARSFVTSFTYDAFGDLTSLKDPRGRVRSFAYDQVGDVVSRTDGNNHTTTYTYDRRNRLLKVTYPDKTQAVFTYDTLDHIVNVMDLNTNSQFAYDANGSIVQVRDSRLSKTISYQYDGVGNRIQMTDGENAITTYSHDLASRLTSLARGGEQFAWTYDNANRLTQLTLPNNAAAVYSYDKANRLLSLVNQKSDSGVISSFSYQYDKADNQTQLALADGSQISYSYDADNQLTGEVRTGTSSYNHQIVYDAVGNRAQLNANGVITNYVYDGADELTQEMSGHSSIFYLYDGDGNRIVKASAGLSGLFSIYSYDFNDRLIGFASLSPNMAQNGSYQLDVFGRRASKTAGGVVTQFFYDAWDDIAEYDQNGVVQAKNVFGAGIDQNLARVVGGSAFFYLHDGINSVRNVIDASQGVQNAYDYDAWGNILTKVEQISNDYTFTGRRIDRESGLYDYRARMYDSWDGRFVQIDPLSSTGEARYLYVNNQPANFVGPSGFRGQNSWPARGGGCGRGWRHNHTHSTRLSVRESCGIAGSDG